MYEALSSTNGAGVMRSSMQFQEVQREMSIDSRFVQTAFGTFHAESAGAGAPVLFVHGGTASAREWCAVLPLLAGHAECVAIDRRGCGESDRGARGSDRATITDGFFALTDVLGWRGSPSSVNRSAGSGRFLWRAVLAPVLAAVRPRAPLRHPGGLSA